MDIKRKDCQSGYCTFDQVYGYWTCQACGQVWAYGDDDLDLEESQMVFDDPEFVALLDAAVKQILEVMD